MLSVIKLSHSRLDSSFNLVPILLQNFHYKFAIPQWLSSNFFTRNKTLHFLIFNTYQWYGQMILLTLSTEMPAQVWHPLMQQTWTYWRSTTLKEEESLVQFAGWTGYKIISKIHLPTTQCNGNILLTKCNQQ